MPTEPIQDFIPRRIEDKSLLKLLNDFSELIKETVNFGSHVFKWMLDSVTGGDEMAPLFLSFRHILELIDSLSLFIKESYVSPCKIILRGILESVLNIEYILERDTEQRSMNFMVWYNHNRIKLYEKIDPTSDAGIKYRNAIESDKIINKMKIPDFSHEKAIKNLEGLLKKPKYAAAEAEYQRIIQLPRRARQRYKNWYSMNDGPTNVRELAERVELLGFYEILYRNWSGYVHGVDIIEGILSRAPDGKAEIIQIRSPRDAQIITELTISFAIHIIRKYVKHFLPAKESEFTEWYLKEMRDDFLELLKENYIEVT